MPNVNRNGDIAHGVGGVGAFLNNVLFDTGGGACWYDDNTIVYQHDDGVDVYLAFYDINTEVITPATGGAAGANTLYGSGFAGWAAWLSGTGLYSSATVGLTLPSAGLLGLGPDNTVAYRPSYASSGGLTLRTTLGVATSISTGPAVEVDVVGPGQAVWQESNVLQTYGLPTASVVSGSIFAPKAVLVGTTWWIAYYSSTYGIVLHPFDSLEGYRPVTGDAWFDMTVLAGQPTVIRFAWSVTQGEAAGDVSYVDIDTATEERETVGNAGATVPGIPPVPEQYLTTTDPAGTILITSTGSFGVAGAAEELVTLDIEVWPSYPIESGHGRLVHPYLGAFDYEAKPDEWVNIDADAIIPPVWASSRTLTSAANVLWEGNLRDVIVEERWKSLGGLAMPITQLRMLLAIWTTPLDPDVGYVYWYPTYITSVAFKVLPLSLQVGGQGIVFDDVVNYKDEFGDPIGWVTQPVTFQMKLVERL